MPCPRLRGAASRPSELTVSSGRQSGELGIETKTRHEVGDEIRLVVGAGRVRLREDDRVGRGWQ